MYDALLPEIVQPNWLYGVNASFYKYTLIVDGIKNPQTSGFLNEINFKFWVVAIVSGQTHEMVR